MIVDEKLEKPINCWCGEEIPTYSIGYGRTPYSIHCSNCSQSLDKFFPSGIGYGLYHQHAIQGYKDMCEAVEYLKMRRIKPTPERLAEYWYREAKGLPHNPRTVDMEYFPSK